MKRSKLAVIILAFVALGPTAIQLIFYSTSFDPREYTYYQGGGLLEPGSVLEIPVHGGTGPTHRVGVTINLERVNSSFNAGNVTLIMCNILVNPDLVVNNFTNGNAFPSYVNITFEMNSSYLTVYVPYEAPEIDRSMTCFFLPANASSGAWNVDTIRILVSMSLITSPTDREILNIFLPSFLAGLTPVVLIVVLFVYLAREKGERK
ncbi:MAG: hypothetical protein ACFFCS_07350 [Candidatus Hodarchaeota archaeon]